MTEVYPVKKDAYLTFDSKSLVEHINNRLSEEGIVTDHLYPGSFLSTLIDIVALSYNNLIYYVNRTASDSMFTDSQTHENMNRLVKLVGYNPIGNQTSILTFGASADGNYPVSLYTIPQFSYVTLGNTSYSFNKDITISKTLSGENEYLEDFSLNNLLYQGRFIEYPLYTALGDDGEIIYMTPGDNIIIDHYNIFVFVKDSAGYWEEWERTTSLSLEGSNSLKYEIRLNEKNRYEIKFGNDINGRKLSLGDQVAIYYLKSDGKSGEVGKDALAIGKLVKYSTVQYDQILQDLNVSNLTYIPDAYTANIRFNNTNASTYYSEKESVDSIRNNAPGMVRTQHRLVTSADHENYVRTNFANLVQDIKVMNNWEYLSKYLKYFYNIGIDSPNQLSRVLFNQLNYADACNFNNIYMFVLPKITQSNTSINSYLSPSLKQLIISSMRDIKLLTGEVVIFDPVYIATAFAVPAEGTGFNIDDIENSELVLVKSPESKRDDTVIIDNVIEIFQNYFARENTKLGQTIDIAYLTEQILSVNGIKQIYTRRKDNKATKYTGISLLVWNPVYPSDIRLTTKNESLETFMLPYLFNYDTLKKYIVIENEFKYYENIEY